MASSCLCNGQVISCDGVCDLAEITGESCSQPIATSPIPMQTCDECAPSYLKISLAFNGFLFILLLILLLLLVKGLKFALTVGSGNGLRATRALLCEAKRQLLSSVNRRTQSVEAASFIIDLTELLTEDRPSPMTFDKQTEENDSQAMSEQERLRLLV